MGWMACGQDGTPSPQAEWSPLLAQRSPNFATPLANGLQSADEPVLEVSGFDGREISEFSAENVHLE